MTRINLIPVHELTDQHLMAEYRELPMIGASLKRTLSSKTGWSMSKVPNKYVLGTGHILFFSNKRDFLVKRYFKLIEELKLRQFNIDPHSRNIDWDIFDEVPQIEWNPTEEDILLSRFRIKEKIDLKPAWYKYYGKSLINKE